MSTSVCGGSLFDTVVLSERHRRSLPGRQTARQPRCRMIGGQASNAELCRFPGIF
jgi:hypothetical protein